MLTWMMCGLRPKKCMMDVYRTSSANLWRKYMDTRVTLGTFRPNSEMNSEVLSTLSSGRISYGPKSAWFERVFADSHHCSYGVISNSGTSSLLVAVQALGILCEWGPETEIIVPALTFVASVNAIIQAGFSPVLVDINQFTYNIDPIKIESAINENTKAIMPVHMFGRPCDMNLIVSIAKKHNLLIIEDCCEAFGAMFGNSPVGSIGEVGCFSTYVGHHIVTGVGGMALTNDKYLADTMRSLVNHGIDTSELPVGKAYDPGHLGRKFVFTSIGHSFRTTELEATIGIYQMRDWPFKIAARIHNARTYNDLLKDSADHIRVPGGGTHVIKNSYMVYPIVCKRELSDGIIEHLRGNGVECRTMMPLTSQPCYDFNSANWPNAQYVNTHGFYIGCHEDLTEEDIGYASMCVNEYFTK